MAQHVKRGRPSRFAVRESGHSPMAITINVACTTATGLPVGRGEHADVTLQASAEQAVWALARAGIAAGGWQRRVAEALVDELTSPPEPAEPSPQLALWIERPGLPTIPWRIPADYQVACTSLHCTLPAVECVRRQLATEVQRPAHEHHGKTDTRRGVVSDYPMCDSTKCQQGAAIRAGLDPSIDVRWIGVGPHGRFARSRADVHRQIAAGRRLAAVGLLHVLPTVDGLR